MAKFWVSSSSHEFWHQSSNRAGFANATLIALFIILVYHLSKTRFHSFASRFISSSPSPSPSSSSSSFSATAVASRSDRSQSSFSATAVASRSDRSQSRISEIVSDADLKFLIETLEDNFSENDKWENVIDKRNNLLYYNARCCKPKDGPLKYLSVTVFEDCTPEILRNFYMDNDYRVRWDKTVVEHKQLQVDKTNGTEIGCTIKKFPLLTPREYVLAWRLWEGRDQTFYCFSKECDHPLAPLQRKYVRVTYFRSGWRIQKVPGRDACEIKIFHQEDAGLNVEMAKLAFAKGIWSYVCKMDNALRNYSVVSHPQTIPAVSAVTLIQKVPLELEEINRASSSASPAVDAVRGLYASEPKLKKLAKRPSKKLVANGLLLLGGVICLSRGHSALGAKVAMAYILTKLHKRSGSSGQTGQGLGK